MFTFLYEISIFTMLMKYSTFSFSHRPLEIWCVLYTYSSSQFRLPTFKCSMATWWVAAVEDSTGLYPVDFLIYSLFHLVQSGLSPSDSSLAAFIKEVPMISLLPKPGPLCPQLCGHRTDDLSRHDLRLDSEQHPSWFSTSLSGCSSVFLATASSSIGFLI